VTGESLGPLPEAARRQSRLPLRGQSVEWLRQVIVLPADALLLVQGSLWISPLRERPDDIQFRPGHFLPRITNCLIHQVGL
jgi:hypothetical protein